ncbi:uncharacterized protein [Thunnus thynnus]|uniref:uncharacterized protein n=1 Tax=Thunnus thynnus TaxID=8237 RepID=UPI0035275DCA
MQWTVHVSVLLLNIVWILFFLQPHPFSVSVQRRSSDSNKEFCIQLPSEMNWTSTLHSVNITDNKTYNTNTTFQEYGQSNLSLHESSNSTNMIKCQQHCQYNKTKIQQKDQDSSLLLEINLISPTPQHKPKRIPQSLLSWSCVDVSTVGDRFEKTAASPPHEQGRPPSVKGPDDCGFKFYPRIVNKNSIQSYYSTDYRCPRTAIILVTRKSCHICVDPNLSWVKKIMKSLDEATS